MGLEAHCVARLDGESAEAKVLLETHELILRAPFRKTIAIADIREPRVEGDDLVMTAGPSELALSLGAATAAKWAKKIATPAPSLAAKLGIGHANPAYVIGTVDDPALLDVLDQHSVMPDSAKLSLAMVPDIAALEIALAAHEALPAGSSIWIVHGKGPKASFGDNKVREHMRGIGYRDSKSCAVSDAWSATRYARR